MASAPPCLPSTELCFISVVSDDDIQRAAYLRRSHEAVFKDTDPGFKTKTY